MTNKRPTKWPHKNRNTTPPPNTEGKVSMTTTFDTLVQARALIEDPNHWIQRDWVKKLPDGDRAYCASAAITAASSGSATASKSARQVLISVLPRMFFDSYGNPKSKIARWNDTSSRTHTQVIEVFDAAIAKAQKDE